MKFPRRKLMLILAVCGQQVFAVALFSQNPPGNSIPSNRDSANTPPLPPVLEVKSPVALFRELLAMGPLERKKSIESRPVETQQRILDKLREYQALSPDERELRLRATELHWYLERLMPMSATSRTSLLAIMSPEDRKLVEYRLQIWDLLPPPLQKELRENELVIPYLKQFESIPEEQKAKILDAMSPAQREQLEAGIDRWKELSEDQRQQKLGSFNRIFELTPTEKDHALKTLSDAERRQIEKTLAAFEKLPPPERVMSIHSFEKFATMSLAERQEFLKSAERWSAMSPNERQAWRNLVAKLQSMPPLPPGLGVPPLPRLPPPLPPAIPKSVATNEE